MFLRACETSDDFSDVVGNASTQPEIIFQGQTIFSSFNRGNMSEIILPVWSRNLAPGLTSEKEI